MSVSIRNPIHIVQQMNPQLRLFMLALLLLGAAMGILNITFNNYLSDVFDASAKTRGWLEFPREFPGFLTALFIGGLFFVSETCIAGVAALCVGIALIGLSIMQNSWWAMILLITLSSVGLHLFLPLRSSIGMLLAQKGKTGARLGQVEAVQLASGFFWVYSGLVAAETVADGI